MMHLHLHESMRDAARVRSRATLELFGDWQRSSLDDVRRIADEVAEAEDPRSVIRAHQAGLFERMLLRWT